MKAKIRETCIFCGQCMVFCPHRALRPDARQMTVDESKCDGCGKCVGHCIAQAISLETEVERR